MLHTFLQIGWFALPAVVCGATLCVRRRIHPIWVFALWLITMIAGTFMMAQYVWALDAHLLAEIDRYEPGSPEAELASEEWANDTDRSFTLLLSPFLTGVYYTGLFLLAFGFRWLARKMSPGKLPPINTRPEVEPLVPPTGDGNPYKPPIAGQQIVAPDSKGSS